MRKNTDFPIGLHVGVIGYNGHDGKDNALVGDAVESLAGKEGKVVGHVHEFVLVDLDDGLGPFPFAPDEIDVVK